MSSLLDTSQPLVPDKPPELLFYHAESCRYCQKVVKFININNITIPMKDVVDEPKAMEDLLHVTGRYTVPCLFIDGIPKYESDDIIEWLKNYVSSSA